MNSHPDLRSNLLTGIEHNIRKATIPNRPPLLKPERTQPNAFGARPQFSANPGSQKRRDFFFRMRRAASLS